MILGEFTNVNDDLLNDVLCVNVTFSCQPKSTIRCVGSVFITISYTKAHFMKKLLILIFVAIGLASSNASFAQVDSAKLLKTEKQIERNKKDVNRMDKKIAKEEKKIKRRERKAKRAENKREKELRRIRKQEEQVEKIKKDTTIY